MNQILFHIAISIILAICGGQTTNGKELQCYSCFHSDCTDPKICGYTAEFLSQVDPNNVTDVLPCPQPGQEFTDPKYIESCRNSVEESYCGKRVIKIYVSKYFQNLQNVSNNPQVVVNSATEYPLLTPPGTPSVYEYTLTSYGCTIPRLDCDEKKYSNVKYNKTLDSSITLEFAASLKHGDSDCYQCNENLCNKVYINAVHVISPVGGGNESDATNNSGDIVKLGSFVLTLFLTALFTMLFQ